MTGSGFPGSKRVHRIEDQESETMNRGDRKKTTAGRTWRRVLLIPAAAAVLWGVSLMVGQEVLSYEADVQIRYQGDGVPSDVVKKMKDDGRKKAEEVKETKTAAWNVEYRVEVENPSLSSKQEVTCILVEGDKSLVVKDRLAAGGYGYADDEEGCVISSKTAWKLFGSTAVVGQWITVKGERFIIRGVTADSNAMVILSAGRLKPDFYQNVSFSYDGGGSHMGETEVFMMRYGFPQGEVIVDGSFFGAVVRLSRILPLLAFVLVFCYCIKQTVKADERKYRLFLKLARGAAVAVFVFVVVSTVRIPEDLIPTKWSDFDFYAQKCEEIKENLLRLDMLPISEWDVKVKRSFAASTLLAVEAALLILTAGVCKIWIVSDVSVDAAILFKEPETEEKSTGLSHRNGQPDSVQTQEERHY